MWVNKDRAYGRPDETGQGGTNRKGATRTLIDDAEPSLEDVNPYAYTIDRELQNIFILTNIRNIISLIHRIDRNFNPSLHAYFLI